jgi:hypothetical protein
MVSIKFEYANFEDYIKFTFFPTISFYKDPDIYWMFAIEWGSWSLMFTQEKPKLKYI